MQQRIALAGRSRTCSSGRCHRRNGLMATSSMRGWKAVQQEAAQARGASCEPSHDVPCPGHHGACRVPPAPPAQMHLVYAEPGHRPEIRMRRACGSGSLSSRSVRTMSQISLIPRTTSPVNGSTPASPHDPCCRTFSKGQLRGRESARKAPAVTRISLLGSNG